MRKLILVLACVIIAGCTSSNKRILPENKNIKAVLIPFEDAQNKPGSGRIFSVAFKSALAKISSKEKVPYIFLSTLDLNHAIKQLQLQQTDWEDPNKRHEIARQAGANVIITGQVTVWNKGDLFKYAMVGFAAECVSLDTGKILWNIFETNNTGGWSVEERTPEYGAKKVAEKGIKTIVEKL
ncbi:MAG: hypothetical protein WC496_06380 [Phycisphaerae bacterium]|jgi:hypothetical protein